MLHNRLSRVEPTNRLAHVFIQGGPKNGLFLRVVSFAAFESWTEACDMSKVSEICPEKKYKTCMSVHLDVLCPVCINLHNDT